MSLSRYQLLSERSSNEHDYKEDENDHKPLHSPPNRGSYIYLLAVLLLGSLALNVFVVTRFLYLQPKLHYSQETPYAALVYDTPITWSWKSPWYDGNARNQTEEDSAWSEQRGFNLRDAIVALPDSYAESVGLPSSQRWPWDESKGIYFIEGLHALHCVKYLRKTAIEAEEGRPFTVSWKHLHHCIDGLRQFVMCHADDTPRYTGRLHDQADMEEPFAGMGQSRQCRSWEKLTQWASQNSACYGWIPGDTPGFKEEDRYKSCPDGRVLW